MRVTYSCETGAASLTTVTQVRRETLPNNVHLHGTCIYQDLQYSSVPCDLILYFGGGYSAIVYQTAIKDYVCVHPVEGEEEA